MESYVLIVAILQCALAGELSRFSVQMPYLNPAGVTYRSAAPPGVLTAGPAFRSAPSPDILNTGPDFLARSAFRGTPLAAGTTSVAYGPLASAALTSTRSIASTVPLVPQQYTATSQTVQPYSVINPPAHYQALAPLAELPGVADIPNTRYEAQHGYVQKLVDVAKAKVATRKIEVRRPAIEKTFYDIEERIVIRPAGSAVVELTQPVSETQKGPTLVSPAVHPAHLPVAPVPSFPIAPTPLYPIASIPSVPITPTPLYPDTPVQSPVSSPPALENPTTPQYFDQPGGISNLPVEDIEYDDSDSITVDNPEISSRSQSNTERPGSSQQQNEARLLQQQQNEEQQDVSQRDSEVRMFFQQPETRQFQTLNLQQQSETRQTPLQTVEQLGPSQQDSEVRMFFRQPETRQLQQQNQQQQVETRQLPQQNQEQLGVSRQDYEVGLFLQQPETRQFRQQQTETGQLQQVQQNQEQRSGSSQQDSEVRLFFQQPETRQFQQQQKDEQQRVVQSEQQAEVRQFQQQQEVEERNEQQNQLQQGRELQRDENTQQKRYQQLQQQRNQELQNSQQLFQNQLSQILNQYQRRNELYRQIEGQMFQLTRDNAESSTPQTQEISTRSNELVSQTESQQNSKILSQPLFRSALDDRALSKPSSRSSDVIRSLQNLTPQQLQDNQQRLIALLTARGGVAEVGFGRSGISLSSDGDAGQIKARVLSVTPAPSSAEPAGERVHTRRIVVSRPIQTVQEVDVVEPFTKLERVAVHEPAILKTAKVGLARVHTTVPVVRKSLAHALPLTYVQH